MNASSPLFAQNSFGNFIPVAKTSAPFINPQNRDFFVIGGAIFLVTLLALIIFLYRHKINFRPPKVKIPKARSGPPPTGTTKGTFLSFKVRSRKTGDQFPRNPTLAESGGLPPIKEKSPKTRA